MKRKTRRSDPTPSERETPAWWIRELQSCVKRNQPQIDRYVRFARWYRGDLGDLIDTRATPNMDRPWQSGLDNMHTFVTDAAIAQMFFRNPRFAIRTPSSAGMGVFTPGLARVEAAYLNDTIEQIGYFRRARRRLLDARLGPYGLLKITYDCDMVVDMEAVEAARAQAQAENIAFLNHGVLMKATEDELHSCHIDEHGKLLATAQRGEVALPKPALKYLKRHIAEHERMRETERPSETVRDANLVVRRVSLLDWFYDVTVDDIDDRRWECHAYLIRKVDAMANLRFSKEARDAISECPDRWVRSGIGMPAGVPSTGTFDNSDVMVRVYEVFDRVTGTIREFFEDGTVMADQRDFTMRSVQPSGPMSVLMFKPDPIEAAGLPPPVAWEGEQFAATALQSALVGAAIESSRPRGVFNKQYIKVDEVKRIIDGGTGEWFGVDLPGGADADIRRVMGPAPEIQIADQTVGMRSDVRGRISQSSGLGFQRTLSGDKSNSATEAAITSGAAEAISEDQAAILDAASAYDGKMLVRLTRKCIPKDVIVETVGPEAQQWYPDTWADRDMVNDRGVYVVPGSSRRRSTSVDSKLTMDFIIALAPLPVMAGPAGQSLLLEAARRVADDQGLQGLPWDEVDQEQKMMAMLMQQQALAGGGAPPGEEAEGEGGAESGGGPPAKRGSEMNEPSIAGQAQGAMNVGGGRVPTGASQGDGMRLMRGGVA